MGLFSKPTAEEKKKRIAGYKEQIAKLNEKKKMRAAAADTCIKASTSAAAKENAKKRKATELHNIQYDIDIIKRKIEDLKR